jgi:hypothetical protein
MGTKVKCRPDPSAELGWSPALLAEVQEKSARLHLTAVMVIPTVPWSHSGATRRNETDGQFGKIVVTL